MLEDPGALVEFSRWITPEEVTIRFDTRFFLAELPDGQEPEVDGEECVDQGWFTPTGRLGRLRARGDRARLPHDQAPGAARGLSRAWRSCSSYASGREVLPVQPKVWFDGEVARVALPGEPATPRALRSERSV